MVSRPLAAVILRPAVGLGNAPLNYLCCAESVPPSARFHTQPPARLSYSWCLALYWLTAASHCVKISTASLFCGSSSSSSKSKYRVLGSSASVLSTSSRRRLIERTLSTLRIPSCFLFDSSRISATTAVRSGETSSSVSACFSVGAPLILAMCPPSLLWQAPHELNVLLLHYVDGSPSRLKHPQHKLKVDVCEANHGYSL